MPWGGTCSPTSRRSSSACMDVQTAATDRGARAPGARPRAGSHRRVPFSGRYINLDRSTGRRARLEQQLRYCNIAEAYSRFSAVDGSRITRRVGGVSQQEYGCFASHARLLQESRSLSTHLHVLEDDALLSPELVPVVGQLINQGVLDEFDLLFTDIFVSWDPLQIASLERARRRNIELDPHSGDESLKGVTVFNLKGKGLACTSSYLVAQRSLQRVAELLERELCAGPNQPVDLVLRQLVDSGVLKAACIVPFVTSLDLALAAGSTIHGDPFGAELSRLACTVVRHTLFVHPDWDMIHRVLQQYFPPQERNSRGHVLSQVMEFLVCGNAQAF
jgi:GR25 family glycosyltransferase involved in LPS biosynthesis